MAKHYELGKEGEQIAIDFLIKNQYQILERNWRFKKAEIDIIAQKHSELICVEVKTRASDFFGDPQDFVSSKKVKLLVEAMNHYVESRDLNVEVRFDIIAIVKTKQHCEIDHLENAFLHF